MLTMLKKPTLYRIRLAPPGERRIPDYNYTSILTSHNITNGKEVNTIMLCSSHAHCERPPEYLLIPHTFSNGTDLI